MPVYLDNAATTPLCESAKKAMSDAFELYANPSSIHSAGLASRKAIDSCRRKVALALGCAPQQTVFTGSGSEGNCTALFAAASMRAHAPKRIITEYGEHPSVEEPLKALEKKGFEIIRISSRGGVIDLPELERELSNGCAFVALMRANNETGAVYGIPAVKQLIDRSGTGALLCCDDVQGFLKTPCVTKYCDFLTVSAHKIGGPKGVGALCVPQKHVLPYIYGGGQEGGWRSGTENIIGIAGFAAACTEWAEDTGRNERIRAVRDRAADKLASLCGERVRIHESPCRVGGMLSMSLDVSLGGKRTGSEVMLNYLSNRGIFVSAGSACHASKRDYRVLEAFGLTRAEADTTLRVSFGFQNTENDADEFVSAVADMINGVH